MLGSGTWQSAESVPFWPLFGFSFSNGDFPRHGGSPTSSQSLDHDLNPWFLGMSQCFSSFFGCVAIEHWWGPALSYPCHNGHMQRYAELPTSHKPFVDTFHVFMPCTFPSQQVNNFLAKNKSTSQQSTSTASQQQVNNKATKSQPWQVINISIYDSCTF